MLKVPTVGVQIALWAWSACSDLSLPVLSTSFLLLVVDLCVVLL